MDKLRGNKEDWYVILNMDCRYEICRRCPKSGLFKGTYEECEKWIEQTKNKESLKRELSKIMNIHGIDTACSTPDYILAEYLIDCLKSYKKMDDANRTWHGLTIKGELKL